jgi:DNA-binding transcriptional LysR family regulator
MKRSEKAEHRLKLPQLNALITVARTGSMAKAAKQLATSQSVVSKAIADLEITLGVRLFDRSPQGVEPTLYGRTLLKRSVAIFDDIRTSIEEVGFLAEEGGGELRVGTTAHQAGIVAATIERLSRGYLRLDFRVVLADGPTLIDHELRGRRIDLMVGPLHKSSIEEDLETILLYENHARVVVGAKSPWARRRKVALSDLVNEPWCAAPIDLPAGAAFVEAFRESGLPLPRVVVSTASNHLCHRMLADGRFVGISFDGSLRFDAQSPPLKILPVEIPSPPLPISIVTLKGRTISPVAPRFIECALDVTKPLGRLRE